MGKISIDINKILGEMEREENKEETLSSKVKIIWILNYIIFFTLVLIFSYLFSQYIEDFNIDINDWYSWIIISALVLLIPYLIYIEFYYKNYTYSFKKDGINVKKGVFKKEEYLIPYNKIDKIYIINDIIAGMLGIGKVVIKSKTGEHIRIDGIDEPEEFIHDLATIVNKTKEVSKKEEIYDEIIRSMVNLTKRIDKLEEGVKIFEEKINILEQELIKKNNKKQKKAEKKNKKPNKRKK